MTADWIPIVYMLIVFFLLPPRHMFTQFINMSLLYEAIRS